MLRPEDSGVRVGVISSNLFIVNDDVMFYCDDAYRIGSAKFFMELVGNYCGSFV